MSHYFKNDMQFASDVAAEREKSCLAAAARAAAVPNCAMNHDRLTPIFKRRGREKKSNKICHKNKYKRNKNK